MNLLGRYYGLLRSVQTAKLILNGSAREYGITRFQKLNAIRRIKRASKKKRSFTNLQQHMVMVEEILNLPSDLEGDVVECGCFNGGSTIPLSIACSLTGRRLFVCDSFEGLPDFTDCDHRTIYDGEGRGFEWGTGEYSSSLEATRRNVQTFGEIDVCRFVKGYFCDTLKDLNTENVVMVFEDADMPSSVEDCITHLWPKLQPNCKFFSHEPGVVGVVSLFYDEDWWREKFDLKPPGMYGSGFGHANYSGLSYAVKHE